MTECSHGPCSPVNCIIPPFMVDAIKLRGDAKQRKMAESIEKLAASTREEREAIPTPATAFVAGQELAAARGTPSARIEIYDGQKKAALPGKLARKSGQKPVADTTVNEAFDGSQSTYDLYLDQYSRDSLDGRGMKLVSTVHHRRAYNNAFWNGRQMAYGDGDGTLFTGFTNSLSVIGHELSHGVVQFSGGLIYRDQSGALNESFADVFGALTVQYRNQQLARDADWLIGDGILGPNINGVALRSMKAPGTAYDDPVLGKDPQPYHMDDFIVTSSDNGGVHWNSGIPNHAFYLLSQYLGGNAYDKPGGIWYDTMQKINNPNATFNEWADLTVAVARARHGAGSREELFTRRAWKLVGISV